MGTEMRIDRGIFLQIEQLKLASVFNAIAFTQSYFSGFFTSSVTSVTLTQPS